MDKKGLYILGLMLLNLGNLEVAEASELDFIPNIRSTAAYSEASQNGPVDSSYLELSPSAAFTYQSSRLTSFASITNRYFYRDLDEQSENENYWTGNYNARYEALKSNVFLIAYGSQSYNSINSSTLLIDDLATQPQNQTKTRSNNIGFELNNAQNGWLSISGRAIGSIFESERSSTSESSFENTNYNSQFNIRSGKRFSQLRWNVNSSFRKTDREDNAESIQRSLVANIQYQLIESIDFLMNYRESKQRFESITSSTDTYSSYGFGLIYNFNESFVGIAYNKIDEQSSFSDTEDDSFYSVNFRLRLSPRTSLTGSRDQDFYGDRNSLSFNYANRKLRISTRYNEEVTSTSSVFESGIGGVFVCPTNYLTVDDCFIPDSLSYVLQPGEQFEDLSTFQDNINDEDRVRKSWILNAGYQFNRLTLSLQGRRTQINFLGSQNDTLQHSASGTVNFRMGVKTSLRGRAAVVHSDRAFDTVDSSDEDSRSYLGSIGLYYQLNESVNFYIEGQYRDFQTNTSINDYQERRVLLTFSYYPNRSKNNRRNPVSNINEDTTNNNGSIGGFNQF